MGKTLTMEEQEQLLQILEARFHKNMHRHPNVNWNDIQEQLLNQKEKLWSLNQMEKTLGEPDVVELDNQFVFIDCVKETPKGRRSLCYDRAALEARKKHKPENSVMNLVNEMGIELLNEEQYRALQQYEIFDQKTSSWILTPEDIRALGGALFCDYRYGHVFVYHNGADSYYSSRAFRGMLKL